MNVPLVKFFAVTFFAASIAFALETKVSKEDREKMAEVHIKMATCLQSDKPMSDCHTEMMKSCKDMMGKSGCPMMEGMGMGHMKGMMGHGMMNYDEENKTENKGKK